MAHTVFCVHFKKEMEGLEEPPFDSELGQKIFKNVSKQAWGEWVERQKMLLNEYLPRLSRSRLPTYHSPHPLALCWQRM